MPVSIRGQFQRSVQLTRDFYGGEQALSGYIITAKALETTDRIVGSLEQASTRAWTISGPYGGGKSSFGLFIARLLRGNNDAYSLLERASSESCARLDEHVAGSFLPVLVVGSRRPVVQALAQGLAQALEAFSARIAERGRKSSTLRKRIKSLAGEARLATTAEEVLAVYDQAAQLNYEHSKGGLLLIVDELGKHLEYAALHPDEGDIFILQSLAERSGQVDSPPFLVVTILHQALERYAVGLSSKQRDDWRKVQGRFEDIAYLEPVGETLRLLAEAIEADLGSSIERSGKRASKAVVKAASLPVRLDPDLVEVRLVEALPLHPAVSLIVGPLFRRLAQNERSLFSFLASGEPGSFLDVLRDGRLSFYRLDHLYDYLTRVLGSALHRDGSSQLWLETEAALARAGADALQARVLKQIAVLSFAGGPAGLLPTEAMLLASSGETPKKTRLALDSLVEAKAVTYRPFHKEYRVWQGSDFDLESELAKARSEISLRTPLAELLNEAIPPSPLVARRHAYATGTSRVFEVSYVDEVRWREQLESPPSTTDGRVVYVLPEEEDPKVIRDQIVDATTNSAESLQLFCVPDGVASLRDLARDVACLDWVRQNSKELEGDRVARREVDEQRADLKAALDHRLTESLGSGEGAWIHCGRLVEASEGIQPLLSGLCDRAYDQAPRVWNELLNRRHPSSSAVRAQKLLIAAMNRAPDQLSLGIEGTPAEYGLYVSILRETGLHQERVPGIWSFIDPTDEGIEPGSRAVVAALNEAILDTREKAVSIDKLYELISITPYGVREGLLPIYLFTVLVRLGDDVAVFEDDVYQWALTYESTERLLRNPASFSVKYVKASESQRAALGSLAPRLGIRTGEDRSAATLKPLPVVGRMLEAISSLPTYVRRTTSLSDRATAVREALIQATEPSALLFEDLPTALGLPSFRSEGSDSTIEEHAEEFSARLAEALRELSTAYDHLIEQIAQAIKEEFALKGSTLDEQRTELSARAHDLIDHAVEADLRSFVVRASDDLADTRAWLESLASLLARTPPSQWSDRDYTLFENGLSEVARLFLHREAINFSDTSSSVFRVSTRFRISVTATHEEERQTVVSVHPEDRETIHDIALDVLAMLESSSVTIDSQLAVLGQLSLALLERRAGREDSLEVILEALLRPPHSS